MAGPTKGGKADPFSQSNSYKIPAYLTRLGMADTQPSNKDVEQEFQTSNRDELIEGIKKGQRPKWVPKPGLQALYAEEDSLQQQGLTDTKDLLAHDLPAQLTCHAQRTVEDMDDPFFSPWIESHEPIERPRSAFHRGDFHAYESSSPVSEAMRSRGIPGETALSVLNTSPPRWTRDSLRLNIGRAVSSLERGAINSTVRQRAPSLGSITSAQYFMRTPTSPLVHSINNSSLDLSAGDDFDVAGAYHESTRQTRRRTLPPSSFQSIRPSPIDSPPNFSRPLPPPSLRREHSLPHQVHHSRRSLSSFTYHPGLSAPTSRTRRFSLTSDSSPHQRTSMVGSFEESILRGRMSSPASKPFEFIAQIGVMGKGACPEKLKCPAHVTVSFNAVFYNYPSASNSRSVTDDAPSPYVGTIDLEQNLKPVQLGVRSKHRSQTEEEDLRQMSDPRAPENTPIGKALARDARKQQRRSVSPRMSIGGAYRVPQQGQVQIIVKNPNKTAVKIFLVPYDLEGMEPGQRTFVRQRSFSAGPIIEGALTETPGKLGMFDSLKDKHILRYLIHLKFCCPAKGRYYLHDTIRVVFANRVPDGKEKLRLDNQVPGPKYSVYKPQKISSRSARSSMADFSLTEENFHFNTTPNLLDQFLSARLDSAATIPEEIVDLTTADAIRNDSSAIDRTTSTSQSQMAKLSGAFHFPDLPPEPPRSAHPERALSPVQGFLPSTSQRASPIPLGSNSPSTATRSFSPIPVEAGDGLLSQQFRKLGGGPMSSCKLDHGDGDRPGSTSPPLSRPISRLGIPSQRTWQEEGMHLSEGTTP